MRAPAAALLAFVVSLQAGEFPRELRAPRGTTPVLDGKLGPNEYSDAASFTGVAGWISQFSPVRNASDLALRGWVKHDGERLYFAFEVTDDVLYGIDTPRWLPKENPDAHELTARGWPWFGDEMELLIHAGARWQADESAAGDGSSWQMVVNATKSRLGGVGKGGLLEGEPRSKPEAFATYRKWIESGAMKAAVGPKAVGKGYVIEWSVSFKPCLEIEPGRWYSTAEGPRSFGLNIALGDLDEPEKGRGNFGWFHHEEWWAGARDVRTQLRNWGTLWIVP